MSRTFVKHPTAQVSGFANAAVYKSNNGYHRETTAAIKTLVESNLYGHNPCDQPCSGQH